MGRYKVKNHWLQALQPRYSPVTAPLQPRYKAWLVLKRRNNINLMVILSTIINNYVKNLMDTTLNPENVLEQSL